MSNTSGDPNDVWYPSIQAPEPNGPIPTPPEEDVLQYPTEIEGLPTIDPALQVESNIWL